MNQSRYRIAPPRASAMIEALRGLGYSTATAIADILDNSISAKASHVEINFYWNAEKSSVSILDNGTGMDAESLNLAMRLGERSPLHDRESDDLGRFGLGLKTASFSQCRRLTVASKADGSLDCLRWDLDLLAQSADDSWRLHEGPAAGSEQILASLNERHQGTLVLWECLDRIVTKDFTAQDFLNLIDRVELHLAMVFHRYLVGTPPRLRLSINGRLIRPWDPFLTSSPATWTSPEDRIRSGRDVIVAQGYVLPHKDRISSEAYSLAAGPDGWIGQQGFYVYRNERLLVAGSWLGLGRGRTWTKEEPFQLARIKLDISNRSDVDWKIDIRKSVARPPVALRGQLTHFAEDIRRRSKRVYAHRGKAVRVPNVTPVAEIWNVEHISGGVKYRINREHPVVQLVIEQSEELGIEIDGMLVLIEKSVPIRRIWLDSVESHGSPESDFEGETPDLLYPILIAAYRNLIRRRNLSVKQAKDRLASTVPYNEHPGLVASLPDNPFSEE